MNNSFAIFIAIAVMSVQSLFGQTQDELLMKKWKFEKISTEKLQQYGASLIENPELIGQPKPQEILDEEDFIQSLIEKESYIEIKKDNVFIMGMYNFIADDIIPIKTVWYYMNGTTEKFNIAPQKVTKKVKTQKGGNLTASNSIDYTIYRIVEVNATHLKLLVEKDGETSPNTIMEFVPVP